MRKNQDQSVNNVAVIQEENPFTKKKFKKLFTGIFLFTLIVGLSFAILYPVLVLLPMFFTDMRNLGEPNAVWIPSKFGINALEFVYRSIMKNSPITMIQSLLYGLAICVIQVFMSAMAGYSLARTNFKFKNLVFFLVVFVFIVPRQSILITQYLNFRHFNPLGLVKLFTGSDIDLINKPVTLYLLAIFGFSVNQSLFVFIFRQFFKGLAVEIEEAALIDGAGFYKTYFRIMLPNALPAILTVAVLAFVWSYGDTYYTNYFHNSGPYFGVTIDRTFQDANSYYINNQARIWFDAAGTSSTVASVGNSNTNTMAFEALKQASIIVFLLPLVTLYFFVQRKIVENLDRVGIVG